MTKRQGQPSCNHEIAKRLRDGDGVPWWTQCQSVKIVSIAKDRQGQRPSDGLGERWIVKGLIVDESPQDMQELVHDHAESLHLGEWVILPPL